MVDRYRTSCGSCHAFFIEVEYGSKDKKYGFVKLTVSTHNRDTTMSFPNRLITIVIGKQKEKPQMIQPYLNKNS